MPTERFASDADRIYRRVRLGGLAEIFLLDLRQYRDDQACDDTPARAVPGEPRPRPHADGRAAGGAGSRTRLSASRAAWKVLGSSVEMMSWDSAPHLRRSTPTAGTATRPSAASCSSTSASTGIKDVTVLTGDIHTFVAGDVTTDGRVTGTPVATEFVGGSVTSSVGRRPGRRGARRQRRDQPALEVRELRAPRLRRDGADGAGAEGRVPLADDVTERDAPVETLASFGVARGTPRVERTA